MNSQETNEVLTSLENVEWVFEEDSNLIPRRLDFSNIHVDNSYDIPIGIPVLIPLGIPTFHYDNNIPLVMGFLVEDL